MPSNTRGLMSIEHSFTCIWFCVSVPVLSVQMTVVAPIVSQACILRTRLLVFSIFLMELASDSDTAIALADSLRQLGYPREAVGVLRSASERLTADPALPSAGIARTAPARGSAAKTRGSTV